MKYKGKLLTVVALSGIVLAGCGGGGAGDDGDKPISRNPEDPKVINICAYNGGYGDEWLEDITTEFTKETGIIVNYETDSTIITKMETQLKKPDYDIYMSHGLNWQDFANRDLLANLDDLYAKDINGRSFAERIVDGGAELSRYYNYEKDQTHYYKVPFTQGAGGFVYNMDMFKEHGWTVPETYEDLKTLCGKIVSETNGQVTPFAWSGDRDYYWDYPIYEWWAELSGKADFQKWMDFADESGKYDKSYENWNPTGKGADFKAAYQKWYDLVAMNPTYSNGEANGETLATAQSLFFNKKAAMIPYGQWAKKEIELAQKKEFTFDIAMMPTPVLKAGDQHVNFMVGFGDSMIVPKASPNQDLAKEFLAYMASDYARKAFVKNAEGPFLAFDYSDLDMSDIEAGDTYIKSMHDLLNDSVAVSTASNNPIVVANLDTYVQPWVNNVRFYKEAFVTPADYDADKVFDTVYATAKDKWGSWYRNASDYIGG